MQSRLLQQQIRHLLEVKENQFLHEWREALLLQDKTPFTDLNLTEICGGDRQISISRELTKVHEETIRSTLAELRLGAPRGEYVIVIAGRPREQQTITEESIRNALEEALSRGLSRRDAAADVARRLGIPRRQAYDLAIQSSSPQEMNTP